MLRVLMVIEDYSELMFLQTVLKKLGFDVDSTQNPRGFSDHVLTMNPDVLVMTAYGKRVHGVDLSKNLRRVRGLPRTILLHTPNVPVDGNAMADRWLETPVQALGLLDAIAELCGLNKQVLAEKFQKLRMQEAEEGKGRVLKLDDPNRPTLEKSAGKNGANKEAPAEGKSDQSVTLQPSTLALEERRERYKKFLDEKPPKEHSFAVREVVEHVKSLRKLENKEALADLERERKEFVKHLFKKKA